MSAKLPYKKVKIKYKDFDHNKRLKNLLGICNVGKDQKEIWINKDASEEIKQLTLRHELVHIRRQDEGIDKTGRIDEDETELEALARTPYRFLTQGERILHRFLTNKSAFSRKNKLSPNNPKDLKKIYKKIKKLLKKAN